MNTTPIRFGIDVAVNNPPEKLSNQRIGFVTNNAATTASLMPSHRALQEAGVNLTALFSPEHGLAGHHADGAIVTDQIDSLTGLPVRSLYGDTLRPTREMLADIDLLLFDIPDIGVRFYTYIWTLSYVMEACAEFGIPLWVLDRPNPLGGLLDVAEGPMLVEGDVSSFIGRWSIPIRHSLTTGELAQLWNSERAIGVDLTIIPMKGWQRDHRWSELGIPFIPTSPGIPSYETVQVYPGTCLFEGTNVSEGRGTALPFQNIGAPWIDGDKLAEAVNQLVAEGSIKGVVARSSHFTPASSKYSGTDCGGIMLHVTNPARFRPVRAGLHTLATIIQLHPDAFAWLPYPTNAAGEGYGHFDRLIGRLDVRERLEELASGEGYALSLQIEAWTDVAEWAERVSPYLLYV